MKLSTNSWHFRFYQLAYPYVQDEWDIPKSFCIYFWKLVFGLVLVPFVWPSYIINLFFSPGEKAPHIIGFVLLFLSATIGITYRETIPSISISEAVLTGIGIVGLVFVTLYFIIRGFIWISIQISRIKWPEYQKKEKKEKQPSLLQIKIKSLKEKSCPIIEWERKK